MAGRQLCGSEGRRITVAKAVTPWAFEGRKSVMSVEQWGVLALVVLFPLLQGVARLRRAHASNREAADRLRQVQASQRGVSLPNQDAHDAVVRGAKDVVSRLPSLPPPLPQRASSPSISLAGLPASHARSSNGSASVEAYTMNRKSVAGDPVVPWLRPVRNLRRAIVVATILGPPRQ
jgi:hypothetical protein